MGREHENSRLGWADHTAILAIEHCYVFELLGNFHCDLCRLDSVLSFSYFEGVQS